MSEHALHLISVYASKIGWILFGLISFFEKNGRATKPGRRIEHRSLESSSKLYRSFAVWMMPRRHQITILPLGFWFQLLSTILVIATGRCSLWTIAAALRVLG